MPHLIPAFRRALRRLAVVGILAPAMLSAQQTTGVLVGRVLAGDVAVPSATIILGSGRVILARQDGRFRAAAPPGRYEVRAQRVGYTTARDTVTIVAGQTSTLNFKIERAAAMLEAVTSVASRGQVRSAIDVPAPVVIHQGADLRATGRIETAQMIAAAEPGATISRSAIAEGSDLIHPLSLRGLNPDQVLVLVNGKRRHSSALLNVNRTIGRGSTGVDLNAIPASMIDHVEILRDGAVAQYGSDAVAGVINIVLKQGVHGDAASTMGRYATSFNGDGDGTAALGSPASASDGRAVQGAIDKGVVFGERGFLHGAFELRDRDFTNRTATTLPQPYRVGDPESHDAALFLNGGNLFANGLELYGDVGGSRRTMRAAGAFAFAPSPLSPNGFLPIIRPTIDDGAGTLGVRGRVGDWDWDLGSTYGRNQVHYVVQYTADGVAPAVAQYDAGTVSYGQSTTTLELSRALAYFEETRVTLGAELRAERYQIVEGEPASTSLAGFPGFGPGQVRDRSRHDVAGYADLESDLTSALMIGIAARAEDYSVGGTVGAGKLAVRWEPVRKHALRASIERGFRVPSMAQMYFANPSTDEGYYIGSPLLAVNTVAMNRTLRPERTTTYSAGVVAEPTPALSASLDLYRVEVGDRIVIADDWGFTTTYLANGVDTRTNGLDLDVAYSVLSNDAGRLRLGASVNLNSTAVTRNQGVLGATSVTRVERGQPRNTVLLTADYRSGALGALLRTRRFGEVASQYSDAAGVTPQYFGARWLTDANLSYTLLRKYTLTAGADNLFDVYPDRSYPPSYTGLGAIEPYNAVSPFGFNGRFVYGRLSIYL